MSCTNAKVEAYFNRLKQMPEIGHRSRADDVTIACRKVLKGKQNVATLEQVCGRKEVKKTRKKTAGVHVEQRDHLPRPNQKDDSESTVQCTAGSEPQCSNTDEFEIQTTKTTDETQSTEPNMTSTTGRIQRNAILKITK